MLRSFLIVVFVSGFVLVARPSVAQSLPPNLRRDIDAGNQAWIDGLKSGNAELAASSFGDDALNCGPTGDCDKGKAAIVDHYRGVIAKLGKASSGRVRSESLHVDHDLAYESGYSEAEFPGHGPLKGRFSTVWKRQPNGHWKIFRNMSLPDIPEESQ
jgi:ketosteroid isomerase-like protein